MIFSDPRQKSEPPHLCYEFGPFHLNPVKRVLLRSKAALPLPSKAFDTLLVLLENRHRVMDKDELLNCVWGGRSVAENNLNQKISRLRKILCESPQHHQYIVTLSGHGYRFVAAVREVSCDQPLHTLTAIAAPIKSIVVLPFKMLGSPPSGAEAAGVDAGKASGEYWGLSLTDALITRLSKLGHRIVPATSVVAELGNRDDLGAARKKLKIDVVLEGRIRRFGHKLRLTVQLARATDGVTLWAEQFDETLTDWLKVEDKLAEQIAQQVTRTFNGN